MSGFFAARRSLRTLAYASGGVVATGSVLLYGMSGPKPGYVPQQTLKLTEHPPHFPRVKTRDEQIAALRRSSTLNKETQSADDSEEHIYDLLIIGGGATGTGIALDAVTRGLKVALVERDDFSSGTSSKSTKLIHGGLRYLEKAVMQLDYAQFDLVRTALKERKYFLDIAPHLSSSLPIMLPVRNWYEAPYLWAGTKLYDLLSGSRALEPSYILSKKKAIEAFPTLHGDDLFCGLVYYDGQQNDARMNISLALTASLYGATVANYVNVVGLEKDENGKLCGARVQDVLADGKEPKEFVVRAKGVINATGPFSDAVCHQAEADTKDLIVPSSGVHLTLPEWAAPDDLGLADPSSDGRIIFVLPWQGKTIAGTTDAFCAIEQNPMPKEDEIDFILSEVRRLLAPGINIQRSDVLSAWSGIRPLVRAENAKNTEALARSHRITISDSGLLTCAGGKWTTYREMAEDAVDTAVKTFKLKTSGLDVAPNVSGTSITDTLPANGECKTDKVRLIGAHNYSKMFYIDLIKHFKLEHDIAQYLAQSYGDRAWDVATLYREGKDERLTPEYPHTSAEVQYAVQNEYARTVTDILARRTRLAFLDVKAAYKVVPKVIEIMGDELKWTKERRAAEFTRTVDFLKTMGLTEVM